MQRQRQRQWQAWMFERAHSNLNNPVILKELDFSFVKRPIE
jgi:hypothetical protein